MRHFSFDTNSDVLPWPNPDLEQAVFIASNAIVLGDVELKTGSSVWYGAVIRGDLERITIGAYTNIQDGAVLHCDPDEPLTLEDYVTIGHRAVIHSAHVEQGCLVGIGAIVLNGVRIGHGSLIGAGAVVTKSVPPRSLVMGVPGKVIRELTEAEATDLIDHAQQYEQLALLHARLKWIAQPK